MNFHEEQLIRVMADDDFQSQRGLANRTGYSLGVVNKSVNSLRKAGFIDSSFSLSEKARSFIDESKPRNAIILAAGFGMRMVPINLSSPKGFLEVNGEKLIERLIEQLHEIGITDITIVVGFMKECFEYLIDKYDVDLVVNKEYFQKNNLFSLYLVRNRISNTYIIPSDIWCDKNPFSRIELSSWYMVSDLIDDDSSVKVNRKMDLVKTGDDAPGNQMIGISYLLEKDARKVRDKLSRYDDKSDSTDFWEKTLYEKDRMYIRANVVPSSEVVEINTYEQLRELDSGSNHLKSDAIKAISEVFQVRNEEIVDIEVLKKGMTNRSFLFNVNHQKYIMRIPGEGTDRLINREQELSVYQAISGYGFCDDPIYMNPKNGYKITKFLEDVRVCDPRNLDDLQKCMSILKKFHSTRITVGHKFDLFGQINFYEDLWNGNKSIYLDYEKTKMNVNELKTFIDKLDKDWSLTHIDAVPDNFLFYQDDDIEKLQLTDWEYSGMQDPHVDIAMFCIYSLYNKEECDQLIDIYFENSCNTLTRAKIYAYISICGLLWSNWCEYKRSLGVEFGEYSIRQYRYAKEFYKHATNLIKNEPDLEKLLYD